MAADVHSVDEAKLAAYLEKNIEQFNGPVTAKKFDGGQSNPTYLLTTESKKFVLRAKPPGELLKSAHAVDREYKVIEALGDTPVPVATAYHLCEDEAVIGSMFYVMSFEDGRIFWDPSLPELEKAQRLPICEQVVDVLAAIHNVDVAAVGLSDYGKPGSYFERQVGRWSKQYRASQTEQLDDMETLIEWLQANMPADDGQVSLIHGDFRLDNMIFHPSEPRVLAVLDWELSTLGHPLADLAYYCMCLRLPPEGEIPGLAGKDLAEIGILDEDAIVERYCRLRNISGIDNWNFYLAFSFFRLAAILQGVYKRGLDGNASNEKATAMGKMAGALSAFALTFTQ